MEAKESKKPRDHVKWDEDNLNDIESTKPVREKITEPKTPYHPMVDEDDGPVSPQRSIGESVGKSSPHADAIKNALMEAVSSGKFSARDSWEPCSNEEEQRTDFEEHRKAHYDEFRKMKEMLKKGTPPDEGDEDGNHKDSKEGC
ncbi:protein phosphatase inhibitor 2-like [Oryza brachyantha]|uniref:Uncharacterized protein n=1 Tax=Oryza brachyantha TaxID=4533 RepID=J3LEI9_ORYBR|nr:protein phosphatase inhibitor 2-like [Oryza brachyantha]XP_015689145.1 protein phosphatase inhibitor 2-like [Oryza brachyantha]